LADFLILFHRSYHYSCNFEKTGFNYNLQVSVLVIPDIFLFSPDCIACLAITNWKGFGQN